jgi:hypothetical protein
MEELLQGLPHHSRDQVRNLLKELRAEGSVHCIGIKKSGKWFIGPNSSENLKTPKKT